MLAGAWWRGNWLVPSGAGGSIDRFVTNFELQTQNSYLKQSSTPKNGRRGGEIWEQSAIWSWAAEEISMKIRAFPLGCRPVDQTFLQCWSLVVKKLHRTVAVNFEKMGAPPVVYSRPFGASLTS